MALAPYPPFKTAAAARRYGDFHPVTTAGRWVAVVYMISSCFILVNIIANLATLPSMLHRRVTDSIILSQFDPEVYDDKTM